MRGRAVKQTQLIAEKIRASLAEPYVLALHKDSKAESTIRHRCSASIGVVIFANHEASQDDILKWADAAMYRAKDAGRNTIRFYKDQEQL